MKWVKLLAKVLPSAKSWIFSDGKFNFKRAGVLLVALILIVLGVEFFGYETMNQSVDLLDEVSDIVGYQ